ncbi:MAG: hypothetical protein CMJ83_17230, partial [Planctomycetes bacterium]|nr:hypothetical protein [Planctomycetota bacterium]
MASVQRSYRSGRTSVDIATTSAGGRAMASIRSRIHPKYKTKCRGADWAERDRSLVLRDDITFWLSPDAIAEWDATP